MEFDLPHFNCNYRIFEYKTSNILKILYWEKSFIIEGCDDTTILKTSLISIHKETETLLSSIRNKIKDTRIVFRYRKYTIKEKIKRESLKLLIYIGSIEMGHSERINPKMVEGILKNITWEYFQYLATIFTFVISKFIALKKVEEYFIELPNTNDVIVYKMLLKRICFYKNMFFSINEFLDLKLGINTL